MGKRLPAPPPGTKCFCGHRYSEHVQGGDRHACQRGAEPPFTNMCPCNHFRGKEEQRVKRKAEALTRAEVLVSDEIAAPAAAVPSAIVVPPAETAALETKHQVSSEP